MKKFLNIKFLYIFFSLVFMNIYIYFQLKYHITFLDNFIMTFLLSLSINLYNMFFRKE